MMTALRGAVAVMFLCLLLLVGGCVEGSDRPVSSGVRLVQNGPSGLWEVGEGWRLEETWRRGGAAAREQHVFSDQPLVLGHGANGQILVADPGRSLRAFDRDGRFVRDIGREGMGPGEWKRPRSLGLDSLQRLWVVDVPNERYTLYDSAGVYLTEVPHSPRYGVIPRLTWPGTFDETGAFLDEAGIDLGAGRWGLSIAQVRPDGSILDTLPYVTIPYYPTMSLMPGGERQASGPPTALATFRPRLVYAVTPTDLWFADSRELRLIRRAHDGDTLLIVETTHRDDLTLTADEQRRIAEELRAHGEPGNGSVFARQVVQSIHVVDDGHVVVQIQEKSGEDGSVLDVFSPGGVFLGTIEAGFPIDPTTPMISRGDTLFAVGRDEMDAKFLARLIIHRGRPDTAGVRQPSG